MPELLFGLSMCARQVKAEATRRGMTVNQHFIAQMLSAFGDSSMGRPEWLQWMASPVS